MAIGDRYRSRAEAELAKRPEAARADFYQAWLGTLSRRNTGDTASLVCPSFPGLEKCLTLSRVIRF
jgi:hypothetical protein